MLGYNYGISNCPNWNKIQLFNFKNWLKNNIIIITSLKITIIFEYNITTIFDYNVKKIL